MESSIEEVASKLQSEFEKAAKREGINLWTKVIRQEEIRKEEKIRKDEEKIRKAAKRQEAGEGTI